MAVHDWTRVGAGLFHAFHYQWIAALSTALNTGALPADFFALPAQRTIGPGAPGSDEQSDVQAYAGKANRITVRHRHGDVVAVIEIISPGNKASRSELRAFVEKSSELIRQGIHLLVVDVFPPGPRDPHGICKAIWDEILEEELDLPADRPLTMASFEAGPERVAYLEAVAVGDILPDQPLFLRPGIYVPAPLEATYQTAWAAFPFALKGLLA
jgi:hypothetical protein